MTPSAEGGPARAVPLAGVRDAGLLLLVVLGTWLRFGALGDRALFGDEMHALTLARGLGREWLGSGVLVAAGGYEPYAAWLEWRLAGGGLDEWWLRLPAALPGSALVVAAAAWTRRRLAPAEAWLVTGALALSPYLVFMSREGRGYALAVLAFAAAAACAAEWLRPGARHPVATAAGATLASGVAFLFDAAAAPSLALLALGTLGVAWRRQDVSGRAPSLAAAAFCAAALGVALWPTLTGMLGEAGRASAEARPTLDTLSRAVAMASGMPTLLAAPLLALGAWRSHARFPLLVAGGAALLAGQLLFLGVVRPRTLEMPWVALRYAAHLVPFALAVGALALAPPARGRAHRHPALPLALAAAMLALFAGAQLQNGRYDARAEHCTLDHPASWSFARLPAETAVASLPRFYREVLPGLPAGGIVEAPLVLSQPLYEWYRRQHGRACATAAAGPGLFQTSVAPGPGVAFRRTLAVEALPAEAPPGARLLIVHKRPWLEMARLAARLRAAGATTHAIDPRAASAVFRDTAVALPEGHPLLAGLLYEDASVAVYDLAAGRDREAPATR